MTLPAGAFVAIVGSSGAGKTTVADLIIGLLRPQRGDVWIDDLPLGDIDATAWRRTIGYVPQETFLFHDTVMANVTLGEPGISHADVETALRRAGAWDFVAALPEAWTRWWASAARGFPADNDSASPSRGRWSTIPRC